MGLFSPSKKNKTSVELPGYLVEPLTCPLANQKNRQATLMEDPVTLVKKPANDDKSLQVGVSYERRELLQKCPSMIEKVDYYPNQILKKIIDYLSCTHLEKKEYLEKLEKVNEYEIKDIASCEAFEIPYLLPSGFSYEQSTHAGLMKKNIFTDPNTRQQFKPTQFVMNINLRNFIAYWLGYRDEYINKINAGYTRKLG